MLQTRLLVDRYDFESQREAFLIMREESRKVLNTRNLAGSSCTESFHQSSEITNVLRNKAETESGCM